MNWARPDHACGHLDDWQTLGAPQGDELDDKIAVMQRELSRCRQIVSEMLLSSGQERLDEAQAMRARLS
ncbi:hypothetical protein FLP41_15670 [Paracoccus marcusii]|uniref:hypothetical protein n=1 Tax=Paracoccus marcusii TaxID=59779 RepID=UPI002ED4390F|nr:hypothetical protein FLP41_15670 [Paracoccus marcusii]